MADEVSIQATQGIIWTFVAISTVFVSARLYTRLRIINTIEVDDYIMGFSLICCYLFAGLVTTAVHWGMGKHTVDLSDEQQQNALLYSTASFTPGILSFTLPKLGVTALLIRILNPSPRLTIFLWIFVGSIDLMIFGCVIILFAQCTPTRALWTPSIHSQPGVKCWDPAVLTYYSIATGALSAFLDLFLAVYPATVLYRLQMNRKKKIGLMMILGMGIFACAVSIFKATRLMGLDVLSDYTYTSFGVFLWTSVEGNTIIIAACIPTIAPLLEGIFGKHVFRGRSAEQSSYLRDRNPNNNKYNNKQRNNHQLHSYNHSKNVSSVTGGRGMDRSRQGSSSNHWSSTLVSSTLTSKTRNNKIRLTTITTTTTPTGHVTSKNDDIESQTSILDYNNNNNDGFDDDNYNNNKHDADADEEEEEIQVPVDHISRRDEFRIEYGIDHNAAAAAAINHNHHHQHDDGDDDDEEDEENGQDGRTMSNTWRRSFSKYGYPGFYSKYSGS